jgi:putative FmdB family regulatory protein
MPIYEYLCQDCGNKFEKLVRRESDIPELACPSCGKNHLRQELSTFAAHASSGASKAPAMPPCASHCPNAGACGMNFNN